MHLWAWLAGISLVILEPHHFVVPSPSEGRGGVRVQISAIDFRPESHTLTAIVSVQLEVFDLSGRKIFSSGPVPGATYKWYLQRDDGRPVANGVYLYVFFTQTADGARVRSSLGKIAVRR